MLMDKWALPSIEQLKSLLWSEYVGNDSGVYSNTSLKMAYRIAFYDESEFIWSASGAGNEFAAWAIDFGAGSCMPVSISGNCKVRLVRYHTSPNFFQWCVLEAAINRYVVSECRLFVVDRATGLEWKRLCELGRFNYTNSLLDFG